MEVIELKTYGVYHFRKFPDRQTVVIGMETLPSGNLFVNLLQFTMTGIFLGYSCAMQSELIAKEYTYMGEVFKNENGWALTLENYYDHN